MESENEQKAEITCMEKAALGNTGSTNVNQNDRQEMSASSWGWKKGRCYTEWLLKSKRLCSNIWVWRAVAGVLAAGLILTVCSQFAHHSPAKGVPALECCPSGWLHFQGKCYYLSEDEDNWKSSQSFCSQHNASLLVIENHQELHSLAKLLKIDDCWIGLHKKGESFYWENGTALNMNLFPIQNHSDCAYFNDFTVSTSACSLPRRWICIHLP